MKEIVRQALREDVGAGDITTLAIVKEKVEVKAEVKVKEAGIIFGLKVAAEVFRQVDPRIKYSALVSDGTKVKPGQVVAKISGPARGILTGERTALNFLQHLSGIATLTAKFVKRAQSTEHRAQILDTRKTTPGLRLLEKAAVKAGGGTNHRIGLFDAVLIKDNHIASAGGIPKLPRFKQPVEIECKTLAQVKQAVEYGAARILLDNMNLKSMRQAVKLCRAAKIGTEASGGVNLHNVRAIAKTGVDYISVGALTHSAPALDISLDLL